MKQWIVIGAILGSSSAFSHVSDCHDFTCAYPEFYQTWTEHLQEHAQRKNKGAVETEHEQAHAHDDEHHHDHEKVEEPKLVRRGVGSRTASAEKVDSILAEYEAPKPVEAPVMVKKEAPAPVVVTPVVVKVEDDIPPNAIHVGEITASEVKGEEIPTEKPVDTVAEKPQIPFSRERHPSHHDDHNHGHDHKHPHPHVEERVAEATVADTRVVETKTPAEPYEIAYPDGSTYRGDINKGRRHGYGVMAWPDGTRYLGQFFNDQFHGHGQLRWAEGTSYTGNFAHDELQGKGTMMWADGIRFQGELDHSQRHGKGTYTLPDGRRVVGVFTNDHAAGKGLLIYPDGRHRGIIFGKDVSIKHRGLPGCLHHTVPGCR